MDTGTEKVPEPGIFHISGGIGTGIGKIWYRKKVSEPVSVKFGTGKKSRNRYQKNLVPEKVLVSVSKIFGTGKVSVSVSFDITQDVPCPDPILIHTDPPVFLWHPLDLRSHQHQEIFNA